MITEQDFVCSACHVANGVETTEDIDGNDILTTTRCAKCGCMEFESAETVEWSCDLRYK